MSMSLVKLNLLEVGELDSQIRKNFDWAISGDVLIDTLETRLLEEGDDISDRSLSTLTSRLMSPRTDCDNPLLLGINDDDADGWGDYRFRFVMEVILEDFSRHQSRRKRAFIQGYTDRMERNSHDEIEPDTELVMNSVMIVTDARDSDGDVTTRMSSCVQVCLGDAELDVATRPVDVFNRLVAYDDAIGDEWCDETDVCNEISYHNGVKLSFRAHNTTGRYAGSIIRNDISARAVGRGNDHRRSQHTSSQSVSASDIMSEELNPSQHMFIKKLTSIVANYKREGIITYRDLARAFKLSLDELDDVTEIVEIELQDHQRESFEAATDEAQAAFQVCHAIPFMMLDAGFETMSFTVDNLDDLRDPLFELNPDEITHVAGETFDDLRLVQTFKRMFIEDIFRVISHNYETAVELTVDADYTGITEVTISIEEGTEEEYSFASFADAMLAPSNSSDKAYAGDLARKYRKVRETVESCLQRRDDYFHGTEEEEEDTPRENRRSRRSSRSNQVELSMR